MFFAPLRFSVALALAAGRLLPCSACLFNCHALDIGVCPGIEFLPVEPDALLPNGELANVGPDRLCKLGLAHSEVGRSVSCPDKSRGNSLPPRPSDRLRYFCAHWVSLPARLAGECVRLVAGAFLGRRVRRLTSQPGSDAGALRLPRCRRRIRPASSCGGTCRGGTRRTRQF